MTWRAAWMAVLVLVGGLGSAVADWRDDLRRLRVGIAIGREEDMRERLEPFREELEYRIGVPVDLFLIDSLAGLVDALVRGEVDYARLSASAYAAASTLCACVEPLVSPRATDLSAGFHAVLVTRAVDGLVTLDALKGRSLAVSDPQSVAGYRVPLAGLYAQGIDPSEHFSTLVHVAGPRDALRALIDRRVDAALVWSSLDGNPAFGYSLGTLNEAYVETRLDVSRLSVVWKSPRIPYGAHAVRTDLSKEFRGLLRERLVALQDDAPAAYFAVEPDMGGGFAPVTHDDYEAVLETFRPQWRRALGR
ncbi:phosphate/phosphite/phosphonate ABC transporter substrate-binding protein [Polymorphum gilvum]|uniref:Phosphonate ABC transporter, periplasmic phosphonate-binding protein n=1 Tax=Polymorphum gilvum (strain LMG 25793 / CGMCC 1.9160 / SL003B-26A1) TaxID=991905 RepID=F2J2R9_POLGS|nr:phosphate/phosphite/phosphonate ABC transporter substrate-binding protein [Polymorphum gilvum]ADZ72093.1 Phosphonate ABC transporter, periplasmic phosphonate-binding protein [Polymorphum gilvum SL003B-26A1]